MKKKCSKLCDETNKKCLRQLSSQWHAAEQQVKTEVRKYWWTKVRAYSPRRGRFEAGKGSAVKCWLLIVAPLV